MWIVSISIWSFAFLLHLAWITCVISNFVFLQGAKIHNICVKLVRTCRGQGVGRQYLHSHHISVKNRQVTPQYCIMKLLFYTKVNSSSVGGVNSNKSKSPSVQCVSVMQGSTKLARVRCMIPTPSQLLSHTATRMESLRQNISGRENKVFGYLIKSHYQDHNNNAQWHLTGNAAKYKLIISFTQSHNAKLIYFMYHNIIYQWMQCQVNHWTGRVLVAMQRKSKKIPCKKISLIKKKTLCLKFYKKNIIHNLL